MVFYELEGACRVIATRETREAGREGYPLNDFVFELRNFGECQQ